MTNQAVQNIENGSDNALNAMLGANNNSKNTKTVKNGSFSNLFNNLNAQTQKTQTNFVQGAMKTNTSSINKKALKTQTPVQASKKTNANSAKESKTNIYNEKQDVIKNKTLDQTAPQTGKSAAAKTTDSVSNDKTVEKPDKNTKTEPEDNTSKIKPKKDATEDASKNDTENLSDINNNSSVEPSPVFSSDSTEESDSKETVEINTQNVAVTVEVAQNNTNTENLKQKMSEILSKIESTEDISTAIEEVSNMLDDSLLNEGEKNEILDLLNKIQNLQNQNENIKDIESQFDEIFNKIQNLNTDIESSLKSEKEVSSNTEQNKISSDLNEISEKISKIEDSIKNIEENFKDSAEISQKIDEIKKLLKNLKDESFDTTEDIESSKVKENIKVLADKITNLLQDSENKISDEISNNLDEFKNILLEAKENSSALKENGTAIQKDASSIIEADFAKNSTTEYTTVENTENFIQLNEEFIQKLSEGDFSKLENLSDDDKKNIQAMLKIFDEVINSSDKPLDEDLKNQIEEISNVLNELLENKSDIKDTKKIADDIIKVQQALQAPIQNSVSSEIAKNENAGINPKTENTGYSTIKNTIDAKDAFKNQAENSNLSQDNSDSFRQDELNIELQNDSEISPEETFEIENDEINLQKQKFVSEIQEDILVDISYNSIPENSGALSVSDEVIKLSMDENSTLKSDITLKGSVLYDSASQDAALIKNAAKMIRSAQTSFQNTMQQLENSDLLNQITNKLTQLKDAGQKLTMVLRPNDLGRLSIELTTNNLGLTTNIIAQNEDVRLYIEKNINALRQQLTDAGINVNGIQIKTAGQEGSTNYDGNQNLSQNYDDNAQQKNYQNQKGNENQQNEKEKQDTLLAMSNYDYRFAKDFSSVLNKSIHYNLN